MQYKNYNTYTITHKNAATERINAENAAQAIANMQIGDTAENPVTRLLMSTPMAVRTVLEDMPAEITFTAVVAGDEGGGSIATPAQGVVHVGDEMQLTAVPARNWQFVNWKRNDVVISTEASFLYTMEALEEGEDFAAFTATFELSPVNWSTEIEPPEATGDGCIAFPTNGTTQANTSQEFLAVPKTGWVFDHWERNGTELGTNELLQVEQLAPAADNEYLVVYKAVFAPDA